MVFIGQYFTDDLLHECLKFWKVFYRLFHAKTLQFMVALSPSDRLSKKRLTADSSVLIKQI